MFKKILFSLCTLGMMNVAFANDIAGTWQQIDDKTGAAKAIISIHKESNNTYTGKITLYTTNFTEPLSYQDSAFLKLPKFP